MDDRILYVDDDRDARVALRRSLMSAGLTVDLAGSGEEAIERASATRYAVVATDLEMPGIDGVELVTQLQQTSPHSSFILVTGATELHLPTETEGARAIACVIRKPWDRDEMVAALRRAIAMHDSSSEREQSESVAQRRTLIVMDNLRDAELVRSMLARVSAGGYDLLHVRRLSQALPLMAKERFDVVLADLSLPDARGMDCIARLQRVAASVPIVVLSGLSDEALALQAVQAGAQDYLVKTEMTWRTLHRALSYAIERKVADERLAYLAHHDPLTGSANLSLLAERVTASLTRARRQDTRPCLMVLDLDRFKTLNLAHGYEAGDALLVEIASRLSAVVRSTDTVARLGQDEFCVLLDDIEHEHDLATPARRIIAAIEPCVNIGGHHHTPSAGIGIAVFPDDGTAFAELLESARSAMYRAKRRGPNQYQFADAALHGRVVERARIERDVAGALERGELSLHYQAQRSLQGDAIGSFEALLRWNHPTRGAVSPGIFVPILEQIGLIGQVGQWVLEQACQQLRKWQLSFGEQLRMAVNISPRQFDDPLLASKVSAALRSAEIEPESLELEVTEGMIMRDVEAATETLEGLKALGIRIAIDDFGTGYSQLSYLARFPVDVLKIDRSITQISDRADGLAITRAVIELGHALGLEVVSEGVEDNDQLERLRGLGCDVVQGYLIARPRAPELCLDLLSK